MLNSIQDLTFDLGWNMVKSNWRWLVYQLWTIGIPLATGFAVVFSTGIFILNRVEYQSWMGLALFAACLTVSLLPAYAVSRVQEILLRLIGKPHYFDEWESPVVESRTSEGAGTDGYW
jgi:hypothetical protein